jgi:hypothetical protein
MAGLTLGRGRPRRLVTPLVVLLVAVGVGWWATSERARKIDEVRRHIVQLVDAAARGRDAGAVPGLDGPIGAEVVSRLRSALPGAAGGGDPAYEVQVRPGPPRDLGAAAESATHHAVIHARGVPRLGLTVRHDGRRITIIGWWDPAPP